MSEATKPSGARQWVGLVLTTAVGIAVTIAVGWWQLSRTQREAEMAETERARSVRQALVIIVEEHVLNGQLMGLPRLSRLIDQRRRAERVSTPISMTEVLEEAEFNILESRYLAFDRKDSVKAVFDSVYAESARQSFLPFSDSTPNANLMNDLARLIQEGKSPEALEALTRLQQAYNQDLKSSERKTQIRDLLDEFANDPLPFALTMVGYIAAVAFMMRRREFRLLLRRVLNRGTSDR